MKSVYKITFLICITVLVSSCHNTSEPNYQYMPNRYEPVSYNTYSQADVFKEGSILTQLRVMKLPKLV